MRGMEKGQGGGEAPPLRGGNSEARLAIFPAPCARLIGYERELASIGANLREKTWEKRRRNKQTTVGFW